MPLIEELPVTAPIKASHGWAYVPDTGPAIATQQTGSRQDRKRAAASQSSRNAAAITTAKQQKAIQLRLDSLNKENYKDGVAVSIPQRAGVGTGASSREKAGKKMTSNVRRILTYQRGFAHYLADEEANHPGAMHYTLPAVVAGAGGGGGGGMGPPATPVAAVPSGNASRSARSAGRDGARRRSGVSRQASVSESSRSVTPKEKEKEKNTIASSRKRGRTTSTSKLIAGVEDIDTTVKLEDMSTDPANAEHDATQDADTTMADAPTTSDAVSQPPVYPDYPPEWDNDPLLKSVPDEVPLMPSERIMQLLISEPPLTYTAARATPLDPEKQPPPRHFCGICGYWGRVKCKKCEEWTCGIMECWRGHEAVCVMANMY